MMASSLAGKRIVITRPRAQAATLADKLAALGAEPITLPMIEITPMAEYSRLDAALARLSEYDRLIFTSANAVAVFWARLAGPLPPALRLAAVGPGTARALEQHGVTPAFLPEEYTAEALAAGLGPVEGQRLLLPHAELAREVLADDLRQHGATVDEIAIYRTLPAAPDPTGLAELQRGVDAITFTSASAARNWARALGSVPTPRQPPTIACIGPVTAAAAREVGLPADVVAAVYTLEGLVTALADYFAAGPPSSPG
jgi:uroporphyrinogen III methyltransferase/synthase